MTISTTLSPTQRQAFLDIVDRQFGIKGSEYGASKLDAAVNAVLPTSTCETPAQLLEILSRGETPKWLFDLVEHLTVGETYFLRDPAQVAALRETILPDLLLRRAPERRLQMWSAGCSTGEEPYTLAILLLERHLVDWDVTLVGTDVNRESLRVARAGRYPAWSFRSTPNHVRDRYFEPVEDGWRLVESARKMVRFAWMNLGADPLLAPAADLDLIVCRNVTIYFDDAATQRLYRALINALSPEGWLMLGPSDPMPVDRSELLRVEASGTVLWRRQRRAATKPISVPPIEAPVALVRNRTVDVNVTASRAGHIRAELEAGLVALEMGAPGEALETLRRTTFRDPSSIVGHFGLARAYLETGDRTRAQAALLHTRRLLAPLASDAPVPDTDSMLAGTLRQTIQTLLEGLQA